MCVSSFNFDYNNIYLKIHNETLVINFQDLCYRQRKVKYEETFRKVVKDIFANFPVHRR